MSTALEADNGDRVAPSGPSPRRTRPAGGRVLAMPAKRRRVRTERPKAARIGFRIAAGILCPVVVVYGIAGINSVHSQRHGWTMLFFGVVFGLYAILAYLVRLSRTVGR